MRLEECLKADFRKIAQGEDVGGLNEGGTKGKGCEVEWRLDAPSKAVNFDEECIKCVEDSAKGLFGQDWEQSTQKMISGAGKIRLTS